MEKNNLLQFRVQNFRSINDSGWIESDQITCLVGVNEAGKTNLLLPLWKLKPASNEEIIPLIDYPRKKYANYKSTEGAETFISADFTVTKEFAGKIANKTYWNPQYLKIVRVHRCFNTKYYIEFPNSKLESYRTKDLQRNINEFQEQFTKIVSPDAKQEKIANIKDTIRTFAENKNEILTQEDIQHFQQQLESFLKDTEDEKQIHDGINKLLEKITSINNAFDSEQLSADEEITKMVLEYIPSFIYYSDYGNLDAEIHLPTTVTNIANINQPNINEKVRAKARTLKVLFEFVQLIPNEILQLGQESVNPKPNIIETETKQKQERGVLLHSASTILTEKFKNWWKQGKYNFRFEADGNYFRIWVNDNKRKEWIELEHRSHGLQWFLSFLLVFLVESRDAHSGSILLLDEPGVTLHPIAQSNLIAYFKSLSEENQLLYTTHSPFLVDAENLGEVKAVYVDDNGLTNVSSDLRRGVKNTENSVYPVNAAIGLTVSDTLLIGCQPIIVEGTSDQIYMQIIKNYLIGQKRINPSKELVFLPTGGIKGMSNMIQLVIGRDETLPYVVLDADTQGNAKYNSLKQNLYEKETEKLITLKDILKKDYVEIEDLFPYEIIALEFARMYKGIDDDFDDVCNTKQPIIQQIEKYAKNNNITLEKGYKVDLAKRVQKKSKNFLKSISDDIKNTWEDLFKKILTAKNCK